MLCLYHFTYKDEGLSANGLNEFDELITRKVYGYKDVYDYYYGISS